MDSCSNCGREIETETIFCSNCGFRREQSSRVKPSNDEKNDVNAVENLSITTNDVSESISSSKMNSKIKELITRKIVTYFFVALLLDFGTIAILLIIDGMYRSTLLTIVIAGLVSIIEAIIFNTLFTGYYRNYSKNTSNVYMAIPALHFIIFVGILISSMVITTNSSTLYVNILIIATLIGAIHVYARYTLLTPMKITDANFEGTAQLSFNPNRDQERKQQDFKNEREKLMSQLEYGYKSG